MIPNNYPKVAPDQKHQLSETYRAIKQDKQALITTSTALAVFGVLATPVIVTSFFVALPATLVISVASVLIVSAVALTIFAARYGYHKIQQRSLFKEIQAKQDAEATRIRDAAIKDSDYKAIQGLFTENHTISNIPILDTSNWIGNDCLYNATHISADNFPGSCRLVCGTTLQGRHFFSIKLLNNDVLTIIQRFGDRSSDEWRAVGTLPFKNKEDLTDCETKDSTVFKDNTFQNEWDDYLRGILQSLDKA